jgi:transposase
MSRKEVPRAGLLSAALAGKISNAQGAVALRVSVRQFQRLKRRYVAEGAAGLRHRLRGRPSPRRLAPALRARAGALLQVPYAGLNDCHATEKLQEVEGLRLSRSSVRRLRRALGQLAKRRRRPRQGRMRRTPEAQMGALVQLDASPFAWLEDRGPQLTLHGAIDDATGTGLALVFRPTEDLHGYVTMLQQLCTTYGRPLALYGDRFGVFIRNDSHWSVAEQLRGTQDPTHFGRMLQELGIGFIAAHSPQAKGRIERLWATLQDRLVAELRLHGLTTVAAAEAFLPTYLADHNRRFTQPPGEPVAAWRRPPRDLPDRLACRYTRVVARDNTVRLGARLVQIPRGPHGRSYAGCRVDVRECLDGRLLVDYQGDRLVTAPAPAGAFILTPRRAQRRRASTSASEGGHALPLPPAGPASAIAALTALAQHLRHPARPHPWRQTFSRRQRERNRQRTLQ